MRVRAAALRESRPAVFVLHGHGTGALRQAIRSHFLTFPGVRRMRPADPARLGSARRPPPALPAAIASNPNSLRDGESPDIFQAQEVTQGF